MQVVRAAREQGETMGGVVGAVVHGLPPGLGSHVHWDRKLDGLLAGAVASIPAIKAVEIGDGGRVCRSRGSEAHDEIGYREGRFTRATSRAGGIEGGMSTGEPIRIRAAMKPLSTLMRPLATVDVSTKQPEQALRERTDTCAVPAAAVVAEQMVAWVIASEIHRMFGGDTVDDLRRTARAYRERIAGF